MMTRRPIPTTGRAGRICAAAILSLIVSTACEAAPAEGQRRPMPPRRIVSTACEAAPAEAQCRSLPPWRIERDARRFEIVATDNVMNALAIREGMTILDIGAGTGQFACEFARRMNGTGRVYATDTQDQCIAYIRNEARRRKLDNLEAVLVRKDGVDDFYGRSRYDLVTVFHLYMDFGEMGDFFRELRGFLAKEGRLVLIVYKSPVPFSPDDVAGDFRGLARAMAEEPADGPYRRILDEKTRLSILGDPDADPSPDLKRAIVADLNRALSDALFAAHFYQGSAARGETRFTPGEARYADWLLLSFRDSSVLNRAPTPQNSREAAKLAVVNKLLLMQRYRRFFRTDRMFASGLGPAARAAFEKAGYRIAREYPDMIPLEDMIVLEDASRERRR